MPKVVDPNVLVGTETHDDAGVYRLTDEIALVQTIDFFPPVVNDAYRYGQIAAANSLSDVCAMPFCRRILGFQPSSEILVVSNSLRGVPSGLLESNTKRPL